MQIQSNISTVSNPNKMSFLDIGQAFGDIPVKNMFMYWLYKQYIMLKDGWGMIVFIYLITFFTRYFKYLIWKPNN